MKPVTPGWANAPEPAQGGKAYWHRESGLYALFNAHRLEITRQGYRPSLSDCQPVLAAFQMKDAAEIPTRAEIFRKFERAAPIIFLQQVDLFNNER
jgi:hypothetical protein